MKSIRINSLFVLLLLCTTIFSVGAKNYSFQFEPVVSQKSFPTNEIRKLYQDRDGYIWIPTYKGLLRYDGYTVSTYNMEGSGHKSFINKYVNVVEEDYDHNLWIGTNNGLYVLNKINGEIQKIEKTLLETSAVEAIVTFSDGDIWVGGSKGLYRRKSKDSSFVEVNKSLDVKSMIKDDKGYIWVGGWERGLLRYDPKTDSSYVYPPVTKNNSPHVIFQDSRGTIWVGTWNCGLVKLLAPYDMERFSYVNYTYRVGNPHSLLDDIIYAIAEDRNSGKLWIGSRSGLSILESEEGEGVFTNILPGNSRYDLPFNEVNSIICTKEGLMWLGMLGGGVYVANTDRFRFNYDPLEKVREKFLTSSVRSIYQDEKGLLWMGIMGFGLIIYDREEGTFVSGSNHPVLKQMAYNSVVNGIIKRCATNEICMATCDAGVWFYNPEKETVYALNVKNCPALKDDNVNAVLEDSKGNLWIGSRGGICFMDDRGNVRPLGECLRPGQPDLSRSSVISMVEDKDGNIWMATNYDGILCIGNDAEQKTIKSYSSENGLLSTNDIACLCFDSNNRLWVGTDGDGLNMYDRSKDRFFPLAHESLYSGENVSNILEDHNGTIWFTTNSEMVHLTTTPDGKVQDILTFTASDGLQDCFFNRNACFRSSDNELFFGGYRGLNSFYPDKIKKQTVFSPVVITDIKVFNTSVRDMKPDKRNRILQKTIDFTDKIVLSYTENNFSIDFSVLNYMKPALNKYAYKLDGYDSDWVYTDAGYHFAYYNNLKSGTYTFHLKGANENGIWMPDERMLLVTILPPPWKTGWAYCGYLLLLSLLSWYIYRIVKNRIRMKQAIEMGQIERQKMEEVNHAKLQFFTNITHELFTPLTIIWASVDELKQLHPGDAKMYAVLNNNAVRLMRLIQQILEFRKVENGKLQLKVSKGNYTQFLKNSIEAFQPLVRKKGLSIDFREEEEEISGYFDSDKLDKILYNLLSNAAKYTEKGGTVVVSQCYEKETGHYSFSITNPGEPMSKDKMEHLFERFYEGDYRKFHTTGTGIGLALTKDLVNIHHGEIRINSDAVTGNTFVVWLPVDRSAYAEDEIDDSLQVTNSPLQPENEECADSQMVGELAVEQDVPALLLVEDNEDLLSIMTRLLSAHYRILTATQGQEAIGILEKEEVDLVVSDVMMPVMDGIELCNYIKNKFELCHIPVILLTAKRTEEDQMAGYQSGADSYVTKPLHLALLHSRIENLLKKKKRTGVDFRKQLVFEAKELDYTSMDETFIRNAIDCVNNHLDDCSYEPSLFVAEMGMSRTTVADKLKSLTGLTPSGFISNVRLNAACRLIDENKKIRIADLAYAVGFNDAKYFSTCFRKKFGVSPSDYMLRNKEDNEVSS